MIEELKGWLETNQYKLGVFGTGNHSCGFPNVPHVRVQPDHSPIDGACTLLVTATEVGKWALRYPTNYNNWVLYETHQYSNQEELKEILDRIITTPKGCWN